MQWLFGRMYYIYPLQRKVKVLIADSLYTRATLDAFVYYSTLSSSTIIILNFKENFEKGIAG